MQGIFTVAFYCTFLEKSTQNRRNIKSIIRWVCFALADRKKSMISIKCVRKIGNRVKKPNSDVSSWHDVTTQIVSSKASPHTWTIKWYFHLVCGTGVHRETSSIRNTERVAVHNQTDSSENLSHGIAAAYFLLHLPVSLRSAKGKPHLPVFGVSQARHTCSFLLQLQSRRRVMFCCHFSCFLACECWLLCCATQGLHSSILQSKSNEGILPKTKYANETSER